jgi:DDE family transposase
MSAYTIVTNRAARDWRRCVQQQLLPHLHGHQSKALADCSFAMALACTCQARQLGVTVPTQATPASSSRRVERLLANERLDVPVVQHDLATAILQAWADGTVLLLLDETPKANDLRSLALRVAYRQRALPLVSICYPPDAPPAPLPQLVTRLLRQVQTCLPPGSQPVLLADRGLAWPTLVDWCGQHHWHYLLRLQGQTKVRLASGRLCTARDLVARPGQQWLGPAEVFKKAGWRPANVVANWRRNCSEPWLLVTDERARLRHCGIYAKRMWTEESFRDDKSSGFGWGDSRVNDPMHAARLLLMMALAMVLAASLGSEGGQERQWHKLEPRPERLSIVQWGLRWLRYAVMHGCFHLLHLDRLYLYPK